MVLAEGAGGLAVPLTEDLLTIDFARENGWDSILVTSGKLGSLNHTILSMEALKQRGMNLCGTVYKYCASADPLIDEDSPRMICRYLARFGYKPVLVKVPKVDMEHLPEIDFSPIFGV